MRTLHVIVCAGLMAMAPACNSKDAGSGGSSAKPHYVWPSAPSDGTPLVAELISIVKTGSQGEAKFRLFNFTDKDVRQYRATMRYLDASGKQLKEFPWSQAAPGGIVAKKAAAEIKGGAMIPDDTKSITMEFRSVEFGDGSTWERGK